MMLALGLAGLAASSMLLATRIGPRPLSQVQQARILNWELGRRWRTWPAGKIFPASAGYRLPPAAFGGAGGLSLTARRIGIAPSAPCASATDPAAGRALTRYGCAAVLRATYQDATGALAVTVGVAVLPNSQAAQAVLHGLQAGSGLPPGVRAVAFRQTAVARFGDAQRQLTWSSVAGPYLVLATVGYTDGRPRVRDARDPYDLAEMRSLASGVGGAVAGGLGGGLPPPRCPRAPGC